MDEVMSSINDAKQQLRAKLEFLRKDKLLFDKDLQDVLSGQDDGASQSLTWEQVSENFQQELAKLENSLNSLSWENRHNDIFANEAVRLRSLIPSSKRVKASIVSCGQALLSCLSFMEHNVSQVDQTTVVNWQNNYVKFYNDFNSQLDRCDMNIIRHVNPYELDKPSSGNANEKEQDDAPLLVGVPKNQDIRAVKSLVNSYENELVEYLRDLQMHELLSSQSIDKLLAQLKGKCRQSDTWEGIEKKLQQNLNDLQQAIFELDKAYDSQLYNTSIDDAVVIARIEALSEPLVLSQRKILEYSHTLIKCILFMRYSHEQNSNDMLRTCLTFFVHFQSLTKAPILLAAKRLGADLHYVKKPVGEPVAPSSATTQLLASDTGPNYNTYTASTEVVGSPKTSKPTGCWASFATCCGLFSARKQKANNSQNAQARNSYQRTI